jgi:hypothetical protein
MTNSQYPNAYTSLKVIESGVILFEGHKKRLHGHASYLSFARDANAGNYTLQTVNGVMHIARFESSRLFDGISCRVLRSPVNSRLGLQVKQAPPSPWSEVRIPNVATLLTMNDDDEILESCSATVLAFENGKLTAVPDDRPRIRSTAEEEILKYVPHQKKSIFLKNRWPFVLVNAVAQVVVPAQDFVPKPEWVEPLKHVLLHSTRRA